jgi:hypothetical protein
MGCLCQDDRDARHTLEVVTHTEAHQSWGLCTSEIQYRLNYLKEAGPEAVKDEVPTSNADLVEEPRETAGLLLFDSLQVYSVIHSEVPVKRLELYRIVIDDIEQTPPLDALNPVVAEEITMKKTDASTAS